MKIKKFYIETAHTVPLPDFIRRCSACEGLDLKWATLTDELYEGKNMKEPRYQQFMEKVMPYCTDRIYLWRKSWYMSGYEDAEVYLFPYNEDFLEALYDFAEDLLMTGCNKDGYPLLPVDLCLFRGDKTLLFGSVSHEDIANLFLTDAEGAVFELPKEAEFVESITDDAEIAALDYSKRF